jgi:hypothetical protein
VTPISNPVRGKFGKRKEARLSKSIALCQWLCGKKVKCISRDQGVVWWIKSQGFIFHGLLFIKQKTKYHLNII